MSKEKEPFKWDKKKVLALVILVLTLSLIVAYHESKVVTKSTTIEPTNPRFVISSWDYPADEYGQGISSIIVYENSTGSWIPFTTINYNESGVIEWNVSLGIKIRCVTWMNSTLTGGGSLELSTNYLRHNVNVTNLAGTSVFSKQNFTYFSKSYLDDRYFHLYEVVLDFLPTYGEIYTVTVIYEVFW